MIHKICLLFKMKGMNLNVDRDILEAYLQGNHKHCINLKLMWPN